MYEDLVLKLRIWEKAGLSNSHVFKEAADAIEELSYKYQKALDDLVKQAYPPKEET